MLNDQLLQGAFLGLLQGLTEFLPISSSAHLIVIPWMMGWSPLGLRFDVMLHLGTLLAVLMFFRRDWWRLIRHYAAPFLGGPRQPAEPLSVALLVGTLPCILVGHFFFPVIEEFLRGPLVAATALAVFGLILFWADRRSGKDRSLEGIRWRGRLAYRDRSDAGIHTRGQSLRGDGHCSSPAGPEAPRSCTVFLPAFRSSDRSGRGLAALLIGGGGTGVRQWWPDLPAWCIMLFHQWLLMHQVLFALSRNAHAARIRSLSTAAFCIYLCASGLSAENTTADPESETKVAVAHQNPILRRHFRRQFARTFDSISRGPDDPFMDRYIDAQIDHYLKNVRIKLFRMKVGYSTVRETIDVTADDSKYELSAVRRERVQNALKQLANAANGLHSMIENILLGELEGKGDLKPKVGPSGRETAFASEIKFLEDEIGLAEERILGYFFAQNHTVEVDEIRNQNMLVHLYRVREMAKKLRKAL